MSDQQAATQLARDLFPELAAALDNALAEGETVPRLGRRGIDASEGAGSTVPSAQDFEARLGAEVGRFQRRHAALAWHDVSGDEAREALLRSFELVRGVLQGSDLELPAPESFIELVNLGAVVDRHQPGLAPVPTPYGIGVQGWRQLFELSAERYPERLDGREPLVVAQESEREFELLDGSPASPTIQALSGRRGVRWGFRLVPDGPAPELLGLNYGHGPHVTLPEMLMLQLMRVHAGDEPLDQASFTWLEGALASGKLGARHVYDTADRAVRISCREVGNQGPHLGARSPVALA